MSAQFPSEKTAIDAVKAWSLVKSIKVAMMTLHVPSGKAGASEYRLTTRPMRAIFEEENNAIWFITPQDSAMKQAAESETLLTFSGGDHGDHVALYGQLYGVDDRTKLKSLWNGHADIAFPKGSSDPSATLLKFEPERAEFWAGGSDMISFVINFIEAKITGNPPTVGTHSVVPAK